MEPAKCSGIVHGILDGSGLDGPAWPRKSCLPQHPFKNGQTGVGMGAMGCFLTLPAKIAHRPTQAGQWGDLALSTVNLQDFSFSGHIPIVLFFVYAAQFLHRAILPSSTLIPFYRTLLECYGSLFCFLRCDRMHFLKLPQNWPKLALL